MAGEAKHYHLPHFPIEAANEKKKYQKDKGWKIQTQILYNQTPGIWCFTLFAMSDTRTQARSAVQSEGCIQSWVNSPLCKIPVPHFA